EVVLPAARALRDPERRVVLGDDRVVLPRGAAQEPPKVVEPPRLGPVVEGPGRALHVVRGQVPLPESSGHVAVLAQDPRRRRAALGLRRRVAGERAGILGDGPEADPMLVATGEKRRAGG